MMTLTLTLTLKRVYFDNNEYCNLRKKFFLSTYDIMYRNKHGASNSTMLCHGDHIKTNVCRYHMTT